ncbi:MAG TPA: G/U mismatch-specific DNA glycosylase [Actinomycetota bacterium]|jgi:TDG/mug DNA glycosylase family protein
MSKPRRPSKEQVAAAYGKRVRDVIAPGLDVLFCGINPGLYSGATGHHFARPGNRFWPALHLSGFTARRLEPFEEHELLQHRVGVTNLVARATAQAGELSDDELRRGARRLIGKLKTFEPRYLAVLGLSAYRIGFGKRDAAVGPQDEVVGITRVWVLPNPSGLNAHYQLPALAAEFRRLLVAARPDYDDAGTA